MHYSQSNLILGIAGGYPPAFLEGMKKDFSGAAGEGASLQPRDKPPAAIEATRAVIVDKDTRSVAFSFGFPIDVKRGRPDYAALLLVQSYLGQHRMSGGVLYDRMREKRGMNYGDYAYIEYFPRGMFSDGAAAEPGAPSADFPGLDPPRGAADRQVRAAAGALRAGQADQERYPAGGFRPDRDSSANTSTC